MFVELVDHLRCTVAHEDTWLVLHADESRERHVLRGTLGCPVCGTRFRLENGTVWFAGHRDSSVAPPRPVEPGSEWPLRLAAFLALGDARGAVGLYGEWSGYAAALREIADGVEVLAIAPAYPTPAMLSAIVPLARTAIPLADGALHAVAVDAGDEAGAEVAEAARLVRTGGRLLAPATAPVPPGVHELARDADWWVGEREAAPAGIVSIASRRR